MDTKTLTLKMVDLGVPRLLEKGMSASEDAEPKGILHRFERRRKHSL